MAFAAYAPADKLYNGPLNRSHGLEQKRYRYIAIFFLTIKNTILLFWLMVLMQISMALITTGNVKRNLQLL